MSSKVAAILVTGVISLAVFDCLKELGIVDINGSDGPWSFRHLIDQMIPEGTDPSAFVLEGINDGATTTEMNGLRIEQQPADPQLRAVGIHENLTCPWLQASGAAPGQPNGSAIGQVQTNESAFNWIRQPRQFGLDSSGQFVLMPVTNTPGAPLNDTQPLIDYVKSNSAAILASQHVVLPSMLLAASADGPDYRWNLDGVDEKLRFAFASQTCNGCHSGENPVSPFRAPDNPNDPSHDELARR